MASPQLYSPYFTFYFAIQLLRYQLKSHQNHITMATPPQAAKANALKPQTVPIDTSKPLTPTHALSITHTKHHTILIQELTPHLAELFTATANLSLEEAQKLIETTPAPPTLFTLKKENLLGTHLTVHDKEGKQVAEWKNPILNFHAAKIAIKFLNGQGEKVVEVIPIADEKISEVRILLSLRRW